MHQPKNFLSNLYSANIRIKYQTTKLSCYKCHSTLNNPMKNVPSYSVQRQKHVRQYSMFSSLTPAAEGDTDKTDVRIFIISQPTIAWFSSFS